MASEYETRYLTTRELAALLRITERKVYDLAATGKVPCSRAMGKLLFPRKEVDEWLLRGRIDAVATVVSERENIVLGSHEPLLEWALRESGCGLATLLDGSLDGLDRFEQGGGVASGLHIPGDEPRSWNVQAVADRFANAPVALIEFAWRDRGLIVQPGRDSEFPDIPSLAGRRVVPRQPAAGSQVLLEQLLRADNKGQLDVEWVDLARTESEAALAVLEGKADAALGLKAVAAQLKLGFVPIVRERFDILVDRAAWFEPPLQALFEFFRTDAFLDKARAMPGYDVSRLGRVHFNGR
jgi:excisionase family DNA binding protein